MIAKVLPEWPAKANAKIQLAPRVFEWLIHYNNSAASWIFDVRFGGSFLYNDMNKKRWGTLLDGLHVFRSYDYVLVCQIPG
jgi:hypothetical protein